MMCVIKNPLLTITLDWSVVYIPMQLVTRIKVREILRDDDAIHIACINYLYVRKWGEHARPKLASTAFR